MSFWWLAWKDLMVITRDRKALLTLLFMPLLLIAILGSAFGNMFQEEEEFAIQKFTLGIVNLDQGQLGEVLSEEVFRKGALDAISIKYFQEQDMYEAIREHELSVGIVIEEGFTDSLLSGNLAKVKLLSVPDPGIRAMMVTNIIEQFAQSTTIQAMSASMALPVQAAPKTETASETDSTQPLLNESTVNANSKPVSSFQYYAAAMGVMFLLMTVVQGVTTMILEKEDEVYKRLLLSHLTFTQYLSGKMLGLFITCSLQAFIIILGTRFIFGVNWGDSVIGIFLMTLAFVVNACGLGILAGAFINTEKAFSVAGMFATQVMAALGGSMAPLYIFPDWVITVTKVLPNGLALQTYIELMNGASIVDILPAITGSIGLGILLFGIGLLRLSLERRGKYA
jgi:ABC-2 type transport system permease protein